MDVSSITDYISDHVPEIILLLGGIIALCVVYTYLKNETSMKYKAFMALGVVFGALMILLALSSYASWELFTALIIIIAGFTLVIRPFREVHFAAIGAILVMAIVYLFLGQLTGSLDVLATGWPRIIAAFLVGAVAYMIMHFAESIIKLFGKLLNWWPFLLVLALICIAESILMFAGYGSIYDLFT